jgi:hypothetical protein
VPDVPELAPPDAPLLAPLDDAPLLDAPELPEEPLLLVVPEL